MSGFVWQASPAFDETQRWVANNGFAVVIAILLLTLLSFVLRGLLQGIGGRIDHAVSYFTQKLDTIVDRNEKSMDRLDDRLAHLSNAQTDAVAQLGGVLREQSNAIREQTATLSQIVESNRIMLTFLSQNMAQIMKLREKVDGDEAKTGVIHPVESGGTTGGRE